MTSASYSNVSDSMADTMKQYTQNIDATKLFQDYLWQIFVLLWVIFMQFFCAPKILQDRILQRAARLDMVSRVRVLGLMGLTSALSLALHYHLENRPICRAITFLVLCVAAYRVWNTMREMGDVLERD